MRNRLRESISKEKKEGRGGKNPLILCSSIAPPAIEGGREDLSHTGAPNTGSVVRREGGPKEHLILRFTSASGKKEGKGGEPEG